MNNALRFYFVHGFREIIVCFAHVEDGLGNTRATGRPFELPQYQDREPELAARCVTGFQPLVSRS